MTPKPQPGAEGWFYFGCDHGAGHHLYGPGMRSVPSRLDWDLSRLDSSLAPQKDRRLYVAAFHRLPKLRLSALSWWDQTVDTRPGSNSIVFAPGLTISVAEIYAGFERLWPTVWKRMPLIRLPEAPAPNDGAGVAQGQGGGQ